MSQAPVGCDGVVEDPTVRFAIETGQDADAAGRLLPGIGGDAVRLIEMSWNRAIMHQTRGVNVIARQHSAYSFDTLCQRLLPSHIY
jgi:hypothetical protein